MFWKDCEREDSLLYFSVLFHSLFPKGLKETSKVLNQDSRCSGRDYNPGSPRYITGMPTTRSRSSVERTNKVKEGRKNERKENGTKEQKEV
jgi:hypothetical protein